MGDVVDRGRAPARHREKITDTAELVSVAAAAQRAPAARSGGLSLMRGRLRLVRD
ncbi:hypothetical protein [Rhodococcus tukisamuensis]|uniref:Uncharacterized protein n=1 Tax=Rhodococcus tukisamuensis TaxID=168276 RepID=A0A1G6UQ95_9NOCA|nr:hypothetical protein [Rhodococcus tukisamuensis]SDD43453.1 hypothetical protein SAMN05444580_104264 [Rhodococcus tukisamuensis]